LVRAHFLRDHQISTLHEIAPLVVAQSTGKIAQTGRRSSSHAELLARLELEGGPRNRSDASHVVQQTLLEAHAKADPFHGDDSALTAWLRQAFANNLRDALAGRA
jgi:hypothetical protein